MSKLFLASFLLISSLSGTVAKQVLSEEKNQLPQLKLLAWQNANIFQAATEPEPKINVIVQKYLTNLSQRGKDPASQGVWLESDWRTLADHRGKIPASAASLTKIATTLAALEKWQIDHQFITEIRTNGSIYNGTLQGDLIVRSEGDPLFVWEEAIVLGNSLARLGIKKIAGDLIIVRGFSMNYELEPQLVGKLFKQAINKNVWSSTVKKQYQTLPLNTLQPQIAIAGRVRVREITPDNTSLLITHKSLPLSEILQQMNIYSNNKIAQMLADMIGGGAIVAKIAANVAAVPQQEIQLINGSGLGEANRISPRAACAMFKAIENRLASRQLGVKDLFPMGERDRVGTMLDRRIPRGVVIKTGSLWRVSALAGLIPTEERGDVCFAITNFGTGIGEFRQDQDNFLSELTQHWHLDPNINLSAQVKNTFGDPQRNITAESEVINFELN